MRLDLDDGYTLNASTEPDYVMGSVEFHGLPVVSFKYRPALPDALEEWRMRVRRAQTGKESAKATGEFLAAHLVSWDATVKREPAPITTDVCARIPEPIQDQLARIVSKWAPDAESARGN